jgi:hypothetical protein
MIAYGPEFRNLTLIDPNPRNPGLRRGGSTWQEVLSINLTGFGKIKTTTTISALSIASADNCILKMPCAVGDGVDDDVKCVLRVSTVPCRSGSRKRRKATSNFICHVVAPTHTYQTTENSSSLHTYWERCQNQNPVPPLILPSPRNALRKS